MYSLTFNAGSGQCLTLANPPAFQAAAYTFSVTAWVKPAANGSALPVFDNRYNSSHNGIVVYVNASGNLAFYSYPTGGGVQVSGSKVLTDGAWHHIAVTCDGSVLRLYVDGAADGTLAVSLDSPQISTQATWGKSFDPLFFGGSLALVSLFGAALSAAQIASLAAGSAMPLSLGPVGDWPFNEGSGNTAADDSGSGNTAALVDSPAWSTNLPPQLGGGPPPMTITYTLDAINGNDANDGIHAPWQTVARANQQGGGGNLLFASGQTFAGNLVWADSPAQSTIIGTTGAGKATLLCGTGDGIKVNASNGNLTVQNLNVQGSGVTPDGQTASTGYAVRITDSRTSGSQLGGVLVQNCFLHDCGGGVFIGTPMGTQAVVGFINPQVLNCKIYDCQLVGIDLRGGAMWLAQQFQFPAGCGTFNGFTVSGNEVWGIFGNPTVANEGGAPIQVGNAMGGAASGNVVHDSGQNGAAGSAGGPGGIVFFECQNSAMSGNWCYGMHAPLGIDGVAFDLDMGTVNCTCANNCSHDNAGSGYLNGGSGNSFTGNLSANDCKTVSDTPLRSFAGSATWTGNVVQKTALNAQPGQAV